MYIFLLAPQTLASYFFLFLWKCPFTLTLLLNGDKRTNTQRQVEITSSTAKEQKGIDDLQQQITDDQSKHVNGGVAFWSGCLERCGMGLFAAKEPLNKNLLINILLVKSLQVTFHWLWCLTSYLHQRADWRSLSCLLQSLWPDRSVSRNATERFTAHRPEEICCLRAWSIRCSLFNYLWLEAGGYFSSDCFNILYKLATYFFHSLLKQMLLHEFFTTGSSTAFVHTGHYNQH